MSTDDRDELVKDLATIITDSHDENAVLNSKLLMEKLVSFIVRRDHRVFDHAYKVGQNAKKRTPGEMLQGSNAIIPGRKKK